MEQQGIPVISIIGKSIQHGPADGPNSTRRGLVKEVLIPPDMPSPKDRIKQQGGQRSGQKSKLKALPMTGGPGKGKQDAIDVDSQ